MKRFLLSIVAVGMISSLANAGPIAYTESGSGDLPGVGSPLPTLAFDIGTNTVSGNTGFNVDHAADFDSFAFTIPGGAVLISGGVVLTDFAGDFTVASWGLRSGSANSSTGSFIETLSANSPGSASLVNVPLGAGTYNLTAGIVGADTSTLPSTANYTFTFVVGSPVPEPGTWGLAGASLIALAALRRRIAVR